MRAREKDVHGVRDHNRTLREACERKGIAAETLVEQLEAELADETTAAQNPAKLAPHELVAEIPSSVRVK
jgi:hypothetical protein